MNDNVRVKCVETLSDDWYVLKKTTFDYRRRDGRWQSMSRETYDRGNGATLLLYNTARRSVILTRQFRFPTYVNGNPSGWISAVTMAGREFQPSHESEERQHTVPGNALIAKEQMATPARYCIRLTGPIR